MGKATKEHRKKIAKRNDNIIAKKKSFNNKIEQLREMIMNGKLNEQNQIINSEVGGEIQTIDLSTELETLTDETK
jgi:hypothetical protein